MLGDGDAAEFLEAAWRLRVPAQPLDDDVLLGGGGGPRCRHAASERLQEDDQVRLGERLDEEVDGVEHRGQRVRGLRAEGARQQEHDVRVAWQRGTAHPAAAPRQTEPVGVGAPLTQLQQQQADALEELRVSRQVEEDDDLLEVRRVDRLLRALREVAERRVRVESAPQEVLQHVGEERHDGAREGRVAAAHRQPLVCGAEQQQDGRHAVAVGGVDVAAAQQQQQLLHRLLHHHEHVGLQRLEDADCIV